MMIRFDVPRRSDAIAEFAAQQRGIARDLDVRTAEAVAEVVFHDDMVRKLEREKPRLGRLVGGAPPVWAGQADLDEALRKQAGAHAKRARLAAARREIEPKIEAAFKLRHAVEEFLKGTPQAGEPVVLRTVKVKADLGGQLAEVREQITRFVEDLEDVRRRPLPLEEALEVFDRSLERTAFNLHDDAGGFCAADGQTRTLSLGAMTWGERGPGAVDFTPALAALFGDVLRRYYRQRIEEFLREHPPGLPRAERMAKITELEAQLAQAEQVEECIVRAMEARGLPVQRRGDAKPALVLAWSEDDLPPAPVAA